MSRVHVIDSHAAGLGLRLCIGPEISCARHRTLDRRATGIWEVVAYPSAALVDALGLSSYVVSRPAVVDDFGSLVCVGPAQ